MFNMYARIGRLLQRFFLSNSHIDISLEFLNGHVSHYDYGLLISKECKHNVENLLNV